MPELNNQVRARALEVEVRVIGWKIVDRASQAPVFERGRDLLQVVIEKRGRARLGTTQDASRPSACHSRHGPAQRQGQLAGERRALPNECAVGAALGADRKSVV